MAASTQNQGSIRFSILDAPEVTELVSARHLPVLDHFFGQIQGAQFRFDVGFAHILTDDANAHQLYATQKTDESD